MKYEFIETERCDGYGVITLNRPQRRNALSHAMRAEVLHALDELKADRGVKSVIVTGAGEHFCAGGDVSGMTSELSATAALERMQGGHRFVTDLIRYEKPMIAAVDGVAYGAGFGFALAADFVLATRRARFAASFARVGLVADFGMFYTLPRIVGTQRAKDLLFSGREIGGEEAKEMGIVFELAQPPDLVGRARELASSFAHASATVMSLSKQALDSSMHSDLQTMLAMEAMAQGIAMSADEHKDAVKRFQTKQPLLFQWPSRKPPAVS